MDTGPRAGRRIPAALAAITLGTAIACACGGAHERVAHGGNSGGASSRDDRVASDAAGDVGGGAPVHAGHPHRAHGHGGGRDRVGHDAWSAEEYARRLESPDRDRWQQPQALVEALGITAGQRVAEVGAGSGYLLPYLSRAVGPSGRVLAEDVRDDLLALARARVARDSLGNVETRLGAFDDPRLEAGAYDLVLMVDVYHHIEERGPFLARVAAALARGGRLVIVDFRDGDLPVGPPPGHKLPRAQVEREVRMAGFVVARTHDFLPYQFVLELVPRAQLGEAAAAEQPCGPAHGRPCGQTVERPRVVLDDDLTATEAGFPAVSDDGREVALAVGDEAGASSGFTVHFVRASDGAALRTRELLSTREAAAIEARGPSAALTTAVRGRVEALEAELLRGGFRALRGVDLPDADSAFEVTLHPEAHAAWSPERSTLTVTGPYAVQRGALALTPPTVRCGRRSVPARALPTRAWIDARGEVAVVHVRHAVDPGCVAPPAEDRVLPLASVARLRPDPGARP